MREGRIEVALDMTLHEITCETIGGYCVGANDRLMTAVEAQNTYGSGAWCFGHGRLFYQ